MSTKHETFFNFMDLDDDDDAGHWVTVTVDLAPLDVLVLDAVAAHLSKDRSETVADALRCYFAVLPRPDDAAPLVTEIEASKPGDRP